MRLKEKLQGVVPPEYLDSLSDRFHVIGDIAILSLAPQTEGYRKEIAGAVLSIGKSIHTVLNKTSKLEGERRVARFEVLAGTGNTVTVHREFGFFYRLDVARVFFNSRLAYERMRVASLVQAGEDVLVPFAGVGPFVIPLAARGAQVLALEKSREACLYLAENARLNRVDNRIAIINGDAVHLAKMLQKDFHRAVVPAPYGMDGIIETILPLVKSGGSLHFYTFKKRDQIEPLIKSYEDLGLQVRQSRRCGNIAPGVCRWVLDMVKS